MATYRTVVGMMPQAGQLLGRGIPGAKPVHPGKGLLLVTSGWLTFLLSSPPQAATRRIAPAAAVARKAALRLIAGYCAGYGSAV